MGCFLIPHRLGFRVVPGVFRVIHPGLSRAEVVHHGDVVGVPRPIPAGADAGGHVETRWKFSCQSRVVLRSEKCVDDPLITQVVAVALCGEVQHRSKRRCGQEWAIDHHHSRIQAALPGWIRQS